MGRNAKPILILQAEGKKHLTKAEIELRKNSEIKIGSNKMICPNFVKKDTIAFAKWKEILKIYKDVDFVSSGDIGLLARYCKTFSEYESLLKSQQKIEKVFNAVDLEKVLEFFENLEEYSELTELDDLNRFTGNVNKIALNIISVDGILRIESAINKKMDMLIKMEDRLFLNPLAKVKNVPKETKDDIPQSKWSSFGAGNSG